ncbi:MAG: VTT domain-containing protein [Clostridia bacterium]|nr:VTT domain-containing protein [Clostridia bacterium]
MSEKSKLIFTILAVFLGIATIVDAIFLFGEIAVYYPILLIIASVLFTIICITCIYKRKETMFKMTLISLFFAAIGVAIYVGLLKTGVLKLLSSESNISDIMAKTGIWGPLVYILIQFLQVTFIPIPSAITTMAGMMAFQNLPLVFVCSLVGMMAGSMFAFFLGRVFGVKLLIWMVGPKAYNKYQKMLKGRDKLMLFMMFLLPVFPDDLLCIFAGITTMSYTTFFIMQIVTRPLTIIGQAGTMDIMAKIPLNTWWGILIWVILVIAVLAMMICLWKYSDKLENWIVRIITKHFGTNELSLTIDKEKLNSDVQNLISDTIIDADRELSVTTSSTKPKYRAKKYQINYKE